MNKVIVIGSGIGGLATAARLTAKGYDVSIFESANHTGGKIHSFQMDNYRFDAGPSLFTLPELVDELFYLLKEDPRKFFSYKKKEVHCKYFWNDGTRLTAYSNIDKFLNEVNSKLDVSRDTMKKYLDRSQKKYELTEPIFLKKSLHKLSTYFSKNTLKALLSFLALDIKKSLNDTNKKYLKEPHLVQLYNRYATYNGSNPYETSGIMSLIQHLESHFGTWIPNDGMVQIAKSITHLLKEKGVKIHLNSNVEEIITENKKAKGIISNGEKITSDYIVSNMDVFFTYEKLLKNIKMPKRVAKSERSSSALIFYWGIKKSFNQLDLHNILFSNNYNKEFDDLFVKRTFPEDPTIYLCNPVVTDNSVAPENYSSLFIMANSPATQNTWSQSEVEIATAKIFKKLSHYGYEITSKDIEVKKIQSPNYFMKEHNSFGGSLCGKSSHGYMNSFFRHPNKGSVKGLYNVGGTTHPGGGTPTVLKSSKITTNLINNDF